MTTTIINPLTTTPEYIALVAQYKEMLEKYQSGPEWYFGHLERGTDWDNQLITIEMLQGYVKRVSPIGPEIDEDQVLNITPTWDQYCAITGPLYDYEKYMDWISEQK